MKEYYTQSELARELGITRSAVCDAVKRGRLNTEYGLVKNDGKCQEYIRVSLNRKRYERKP